ncbi:hypothetical protein MTO96_048179 [Rhipicephalus appendiculatus]
MDGSTRKSRQPPRTFRSPSSPSSRSPPSVSRPPQPGASTPLKPVRTIGAAKHQQDPDPKDADTKDANPKYADREDADTKDAGPSSWQDKAEREVLPADGKEGPDGDVR